ncbi:MAG: SdrD B-like domain-containing protein, partial [Saprospiraceae bacterium]|nr:SdrD B-like domain-containing protein [Saprospiraceae bacterium]
DESEIDPDYVDVFDGDETPEDGNDAVDNLDDDMIAVTLEPGEDDEDNNFVEEQLGSISGNVSEDIDNDDIGDTPIEGVEITLTDVDSGATFTTTTDENGNYSFEGLEPGDYKVMFQDESEIDPDYVDVFDGDETPEDGNDAVDNLDDDMIAVTLEPGEDDEDNNAVEEKVASIGDFVWEDLNANGLQDSNEPPLEGIAVSISNIDGTNVIDADGVLQTPQSSDVNGLYLFDRLLPGEYIITFETSADINGVSYNLTFENQDGNDVDDTDSVANTGDSNNDSDADENTGESYVINLIGGEDEREIDAGYYELASIGDFVWEDLDADGIQDDNEPGIEGVVVTLNGLLNNNDNTSIGPLTTTTDEFGFYSFDGLIPGDYTITFPVTTELEPGTANLTLEDVSGANTDSNEVGDDSDPNPISGIAETITLTSGEDYEDLDAGYFAPANISHEKMLVSTTPNANGTYTVVYSINVINEGGITGDYSLFDQPGFDDDIIIETASYTVNGGGSNALAGDGPWQLADGMSLVRDGEDIYLLTVVVSIDLEAGSSDGGDNEYTECGNSTNGDQATPGEGLFNLSQLDKDNDGDIDEEDDACGDLPYIVMNKDFVSATSNGDGTYNVKYTITVENIGGADGTYGLTDDPLFDDDITINAWDFTFVDVDAGIGNGPSF